MIGPKIIVLGAGPTGLACARELSRHPGVDWLLVDTHRSDVDERSASIDHAGFLWDPGYRTFVNTSAGNEAENLLSTVLGTSLLSISLATEDLGALRAFGAIAKEEVAEFGYPLTGGSSIVWRMLRGSLPADRVVRHARIESIDASARTVRFTDGEIEVYDALLSTIPLDILASRLSGVDPGVHHSLLSLERPAAHLVGVAIGSEPPSWIERRCFLELPTDVGTFDLVAVLSNLSPSNVPCSQRQWSLLVDAPESRLRGFDVGSIVSETVDRLFEVEILPPISPIKNLWHRRVTYGALSRGPRERGVDEALVALQRRGIFSVGALGEWNSGLESLEATLAAGRRVGAAAMDFIGAMSVPDHALVGSWRC